MKGKIRTKEKCPKCQGKFIDYQKVMACPECLKKGEIIVPEKYYIDLFWNGKQRKIYSDNDGRILNNYELAHRVLIEIRQKIDKHKLDPGDYVAKKYVALQFGSYARGWAKKYQELVDREQIAPTTAKERKRLVEKYYIPFFKSMDIRDIRAGDIEDFYLDLPQKLSSSSQKIIMNILHKLFNDAKRRRNIKEVPEFPQIETTEPITKWLDEETQDVIYKQIPDIHKPIFFFMLRQGVRPSEARALHWEDIDLENGAITIRRTFSDNIYREKTKTKNQRVIPLDDDVYDMLKGMRNLSGFVFKFKTKVYTNRSTIAKIWDRAVKRTGLPHISLYEGTRHSVASQAGNRGEDLNLIQSLLGHTNSKTTRRYVHLNAKGLKVVLRRKAKVVKINGKKASPND